MNKAKMGKYIKELRKLNNYSQESLADKIMEMYAKKSYYGKQCSANAIGEWENGVTIPSQENLEILSSIFEKTVDEILEGADIETKDYKKEYFIYDDNWGMNYLDKNYNLYEMRNEQIFKVVSRFKELLVKIITEELSTSEDEEMRFLFEHFYELTDYAEKYYKIDSNDSYLLFKNAVIICLNQIRNEPFEEKYFEIEKFYTEKSKIRFSYRTDVGDATSTNSDFILNKRLDALEDWQKDMLLATFQNLDPFDPQPDKYGSQHFERYEKENGEYDRETYIKKQVAHLINHGAKINRYFLSFIEKRIVKKRIIDRLEELYDLCFKPIRLLLSNDEGKEEYYEIDNSPKNRFIKDYYISLKVSMNIIDGGSNEDLEEKYELIISNDYIPEYLILELLKKENIDTNKSKKYWMADFKQRYPYLINQWNEFKETEKKIADGIKEYNRLKDKLLKGEITYDVVERTEVGGQDYDEIRDYIEFWKKDLSYSEFIGYRDDQMTDELLNNIDKLSVSEIRNKYFKKEVRKVE